MENEFLTKIQKITSAEKLITLQKTKKITKDDPPEWLHLKEAYDACNDSIERTVVSLLNSIMYQRRIYFVLTRDVTANLVREDKNHKMKTAFRNSLWPTIIAKCTNELNMLELVAKENNVAAYKCIDETINNYIKIDEQKQLQETIEFIENMNGKSQYGDGIGDVESKKGRKTASEQVRKPEKEEKEEKKVKTEDRYILVQPAAVNCSPEITDETSEYY